MKTSEETCTDWFGTASHTTRRSPSKANIVAAMEEYASQFRQQPEPQPIEKMFEMDTNPIHIWAKYRKSSDVTPATYWIHEDGEKMIATITDSYFKPEACIMFESFIPAQPPSW